MKNKIRPIDANALSGKIKEYMADFPNATARLTTCQAILFMLGDENQTPTLVAYPPARIDREKWEPCEWCGSIGEKPDNWVCTLEDDNGHTVTNNHMVVCAPVNYCPVCGRPLTPEAWEEMEKRLMLLPEPPKEG